MEKQNILINVRGSHVGQGEENTLELLTEGLLTRENGSYTIEYEETWFSGGENTKTRLTLEGEKVRLRRTGAMESEFEFTKRQMYEAVYDTPYGAMQVSVLPTQVDGEFSGAGGRIDLEYVVRFGEQSVLNRLNINYKLKS